MRETIARSPDLVLMCEWSGVSYNSIDAEQKKSELLSWFVGLRYRFYILTSKLCGESKFKEVDVGYVLKITRRSMMDIFFIPGHIDPNKLE